MRIRPARNITVAMGPMACRMVRLRHAAVGVAPLSAVISRVAGDEASSTVQRSVSPIVTSNVRSSAHPTLIDGTCRVVAPAPK